MKIHNHSEQFDNSLHSVCGKGNKIVTSNYFEATDPNLRCKVCERDWFPNGQPEWHRKQAMDKLNDEETTL